MSETARKLFEGLRTANDQALAIGKGLASQLGPEASRLMTQGSMELASALFSGHGFVPYGPGQYTPSPTPDHAPAQQQQASRGLER